MTADGRKDAGRRRLVLALAVAAAAFAVHAGAVNAAFIWDDPIVLERQLPYFESVADAFFTPEGIPQLAGDYYRPLVVVSYLADDALVRAFWPPEERERGRRIVFHASPIFFHVLASLLVFALGLQLAGRDRPGADWVAGTAALLFAVHPIHVESVAWMAGRSDVLAGVFFLAATIALCRSRTTGHGGWLALAGVAALGAMLSKEAGLGLLLLAPAVPLLVDGPRRRWIEPAVVAAAAVVYFALRRMGIEMAGSPALEAAPDLARLPAALGWYVAKLVWPPPQSAFVGRLPGPWSVVLGLAAAAAGLAAAAWLWRARRSGVLLALALFAAALAPSLLTALFPIGQTPVAERYLYIPSAGACLALALAAAGVRFCLPLAAAAAIPFAVLSLERVTVFTDDLAFWEDTARKSPDEAVPAFFLGVLYAERGRDAEAEALFRRALERTQDADGRARALSNLGFLAMRAGRYEDAIARYRESVELSPEQDVAHHNWAVALLKSRGEAAVPEAIAHLEASLRINPRSPAVLLEYGALLARIGRPDAAAPVLRRVVELAPGTPAAGRATTLLAPGPGTP